MVLIPFYLLGAHVPVFISDLCFCRLFDTTRLQGMECNWIAYGARRDRSCRHYLKQTDADRLFTETKLLPRNSPTQQRAREKERQLPAKLAMAAGIHFGYLRPRLPRMVYHKLDGLQFIGFSVKAMYFFMFGEVRPTFSSRIISRVGWHPPVLLERSLAWDVPVL